MSGRNTADYVGRCTVSNPDQLREYLSKKPGYIGEEKTIFLTDRKSRGSESIYRDFRNEGFELRIKEDRVCIYGDRREVEKTIDYLSNSGVRLSGIEMSTLNESLNEKWA